MCLVRYEKTSHCDLYYVLCAILGLTIIFSVWFGCASGCASVSWFCKTIIICFNTYYYDLRNCSKLSSHLDYPHKAYCSSVNQYGQQTDIKIKPVGCALAAPQLLGGLVNIGQVTNKIYFYISLGQVRLEIKYFLYQIRLGQVRNTILFLYQVRLGQK